MAKMILLDKSTANKRLMKRLSESSGVDMEIEERLWGLSKPKPVSFTMPDDGEYYFEEASEPYQVFSDGVLVTVDFHQPTEHEVFI